MMRWLRPTSPAMIGLATFVVVGVVMAIKGETIFSPGNLNADHHGARLGGVASHAEIAQQCSACHAAPWSNQTMAGHCLNCHTDVTAQLDANGPMHGLLANGRECRSCHSEHRGDHASLTDMSRFDHDFAAYKLTGQHRSTDCGACHVNNLFKGTSQSCVVCHVEPTFHKGRFGTECAACHSTGTWKDVPLKLAKLGSFDHDRTDFKLTGKHTTVECQSCHANNVFKGTSQTCVSCHAEPAVPKAHQVRYGTHCASCHTTTTWAESTFKHTAFSISHGRRNNTCATCHKDQDHFEKYTCYSCHEHDPARIERIHARRKVANLDACIECHGRKRRADLGDLDNFTGGCPVVAMDLGRWDSGRHQLFNSRPDKFFATHAGNILVEPVNRLTPLHGLVSSIIRAGDLRSEQGLERPMQFVGHSGEILERVFDAGRGALIRRVTFDLTSLPPTPEEIDPFTKATSADAFEKVVDLQAEELKANKVAVENDVRVRKDIITEHMKNDVPVVGSPKSRCCV